MTHEEDDLLAILQGDKVQIPELNITTSRRGALAAFWDGYRDGRDGLKRKVNPDYEEPAIYRRAHARGVVSRKELP